MSHFELDYLQYLKKKSNFINNISKFIHGIITHSWSKGGAPVNILEPKWNLLLEQGKVGGGGGGGVQ